MSSFKDLTGKRFGRLMVIKRAMNYKRYKEALWLCQCDCGNQTVVAAGHLRDGHTKSCGCLTTEKKVERNTTHGMSKTPIYNIWQLMRIRCNNPNNPGYRYYGDRGIRVCERWNDFENFLEDMGIPPNSDYSIDRIDNDGNYEPGNCRWANKFQQANNRRINRKIEFRGECLTIAQWARKIGVLDSTLRLRLSNGWSIEKTLTTPVEHDRHRTIKFRGETLTIAQWARKFRMHPSTLYYRLQKDWSIEKTLTTPVKKQA
jgi:hypothetical protein